MDVPVLNTLTPTYEGLPVYKAIFEDPDEGIFAVGLVSYPAIEVGWKAYSKAKKYQVMGDEERQLVTGPLLIPGQPILQYIDGKQAYIVHDEQFVRQAAHKFMVDLEKTAQGEYTTLARKDRVTFEHYTKMPDSYVVESWVIEDPLRDKAASMGFNLPRGTWMMTVHVLNKADWTNLIKSGVTFGFSLEGFFGEKKVEFFSEGGKKKFRRAVNLNQQNPKPMFSETVKKLKEFMATKKKAAKTYNTAVSTEDGQAIVVPESGVLFVFLEVDGEMVPFGELRHTLQGENAPPEGFVPPASGEAPAEEQPVVTEELKAQLREMSAKSGQLKETQEVVTKMFSHVQALTDKLQNVDGELAKVAKLLSQAGSAAIDTDANPNPTATAGGDNDSPEAMIKWLAKLDESKK